MGIRFKIGILALGLAIGLAGFAETLYGQNAAGTGGTPTRLIASSTISISAGTPAVIVSAVTGKQVAPKSMKLAAISTGGIVTFYDGADATKPLCNFYCPASTTVNNNVDVPENLLRTITTTSGSGLCAQLNGCTLCYTVEFQTQ